MIKRRAKRSDVQQQTYLHAADKVKWNGDGFIRYGRLYLTTCDICGMTAGIKSAGEINRTRKANNKIVCSARCRRDPKFTRKCKTCGNQFRSWDNSKLGSATFCSQKCYAIWQQSEENCRENNPNWKGVGEYRMSRGTVAYKNWRTSVFERDDYTCQKCMTRGTTLNAHHIKPYKDFPELELDIDNGVTLCVGCHLREHQEQGNKDR